MFEFRYEVAMKDRAYASKRSVTMTVDVDASIDEILESFQDFLLGAGYIIDPVMQKIILADSENGAL